MRNSYHVGRRGRAVWLGVLLTVVAGCGDFLEVTNPGAVENDALKDSQYIELMVNGVVGDFQPAFAWTALWSGVFVDELRNHHPYFEYPQLDRREVEPTHGTYALGIYNGLHRARFLADSTAGRLRVMLADSAARDIRMARTLAYGGYSWTFLGEQFCETPINAGSELLSSRQLLETALQRFDEAMSVAAAARAAASSRSTPQAQEAYAASADSLANLARVGAARAALFLSALDPSYAARALEYARAVPADFEFYAHYRDGNSFSERRRTGNPYWEFVSAGRWFSISGTPYEGLADPRVPHSGTTVTAADGTQRILPNSPSAFSTYDGTVEGRPFEATSSIRLASGLEARYVIAELEGASASNLAFINERRAIGNLEPLPASVTSAEYADALREQRRRDLYLDGHRLGDLRRYKEVYGLDEFPSGPYFDSSTATYGTQECWPIPINEQNR